MLKMIIKVKKQNLIVEGLNPERSFETYLSWQCVTLKLTNLCQFIDQPTTAQQCRSATGKNILEDLFSSVLLQFKKYFSSGNLKFNYLGIFQSLKLRIFVEKIISISLKLNITPNTLGCYGLTDYS